MISQTDRENIIKLQKLRKHKIDKIIIEIKKAKKQLTDAINKTNDLKTEVHEYHESRKLSHSKLFTLLKDNNAININTLQSYREDNQKLIDEEEDLLNNIKKAEESIIEKEKEVESFQSTLLMLNKKIESLKEINIQH